jgi:hypothetical protein
MSRDGNPCIKKQCANTADDISSLTRDSNKHRSNLAGPPRNVIGSVNVHTSKNSPADTVNPVARMVTFLIIGLM